jgi:hypothetical protein
MNIPALTHATLALVAIIGIIVLQALGKGQVDLFALLGGIAGFSGQSASMHALLTPSEGEK